MQDGVLSGAEIELIFVADALYDRDCKSLKADIEKIRGGKGYSLGECRKSRGVCLALALGALDASGMDASGELRKLLSGRRSSGVQPELAGSVVKTLFLLYGGDCASLKADLLKAGFAGRLNAADYPKERGVCLTLFLGGLGESDDGLEVLENLAAGWENRRTKNGGRRR